MFTNKIKEACLELIMIVCGIVGTLGCFLHTFPLPMSTFLCYMGLGITGSYFYFAYSLKHKKKLLLIGLGLYLLFMIITFNTWKHGLLYVLNIILKVYESNSQFTFQSFRTPLSADTAAIPVLYAVWIFMIPVCVMIIRTIRCKHSYFLAFFVSIPFLFFILLFTLRPDPIYFTILMSFYLMLFAMSFASHHNTYHTASSLLKCGLCFGMCGFLVMSTMRWIAPEQAYVRSGFIESTRAQIQQKVRELIQGSIENDVGELDLSTATNRYYLNVTDLRVEMENPQAMYVHAFSASKYENQSWKLPTDEEFTSHYDIGEGELLHPFEFVRGAAEAMNMANNTQQVTITNVQADPNYIYMPYGINDRMPYEYVQDAYMTSEERVGEATFHVWPAENQRRLQSFTDAQHYAQRIRDLNLEVPASLRTTLNSLKIPGMYSYLNESERITLIQEHMRSFGTYTLTPGATPEGKDFITYFLKESQRGYCVHYASAAVMLLRYYGIPARYASGYRVGLEAFKNGEASVLDSDAHAWVEILDETLGWIPLEVTPASSTTENPSADQIDGFTQNPEQNQKQPQTTPSNSDTTPKSESTPTTTNTQSFDLSNWLFVIIACLVAIGIALRRVIKLKKWNTSLLQKDNRKAIIACNDYLKAIDMKETNMDDAIREIMEEAMFSNHEMNETKRNMSVAYCKKAMKEKMKKATILQKIIYRYLKGVA